MRISPLYTPNSSAAAQFASPTETPQSPSPEQDQVVLRWSDTHSTKAVSGVGFGAAGATLGALPVVGFLSGLLLPASVLGFMGAGLGIRLADTLRHAIFRSEEHRAGWEQGFDRAGLFLGAAAGLCLGGVIGSYVMGDPFVADGFLQARPMVTCGLAAAAWGVIKES